LFISGRQIGNILHRLVHKTFTVPQQWRKTSFIPAAYHYQNGATVLPSSPTQRGRPMSETDPQPRIGAVCDVDALVAYFAENELAVYDGTFLYRSLLPRHLLRIDVGRIHDPRLRELVGSGIVTHERGLFEIGCLRVHRLDRDLEDRKSTRLNSSHPSRSRMPSSA